MSSEWDQKLVIGGKPKKSVVAKKESDVNAARRAGQAVSTDKKLTPGLNTTNAGSDHARIAKLDRENEVAPPSKVAPSVGKAIMAARMELKLTQKDLAVKVNEKANVIQDYEGGKAIPNAQVLGKLERILGVKLRGANIGAKMEGPGSKKKAEAEAAAATTSK
ncbi:multiprotein-bridging factor 1 [Tulasnella sp. JGI-2019a]|nr:multiprotein-bridging factor 1 [Tulasnella sp. JGI-2019a]KAG9016976.1 multiprotein-bridging factor 1 [Tulasnella sp. JGI-2019a]KAG9040126.1 multiprotein-bridging factor 1 [Tulasnella sp. JGI-2019a]